MSTPIDIRGGHAHGVVEALEVVRLQAGARWAMLLPGSAGLLGLEPVIRSGEAPRDADMATLFSEAMAVPGRNGVEIAQRLAAIFGERRRSGLRRLLVRVALPEAGGTQLLLERGDGNAPSEGLALGIEDLVALVRKPALPVEVAEAVAFIAEDTRLSLLADRSGIPLAVSPLLRQALGGDRSGRPFFLPTERQAFFLELRQRSDERPFPVVGLGHPGEVRLQPLLDGTFLLAVVEGEVALATSLRAVADSEVTPRELACGLCLAEGMSYREIGHRLGVSPDTVKLHLRAIYQKLGVDGRDGLVARMAGLAPPPALVRAIRTRLAG